MDFNTGNSGSSRGFSNGPSRSLFGGEGAQRPSSDPAGGTGSEFDLSNPLGSFLQTIRGLISDPTGFFRALPPRGSFLNPLAFAAICSVLAAIPVGVLFVLLSLLAADVTVVITALISSLVLFVAFPVGTVVSAFVNAAIYHLILYLLVRHNNAGFEATLRVLCYASFPVVLAFLFLIPILNVLVGLAISVYVVILIVIRLT